MTISELKDFFDKQKWIFARTYADSAPHEYCLKRQLVGEESEFVDAVKYIKEKGFKAKFFGQPNDYVCIEGYTYWVMWPVAEEAILINRSKTKDYDIYIYPKRKEEKE